MHAKFARHVVFQQTVASEPTSMNQQNISFAFQGRIGILHGFAKPQHLACSGSWACRMLALRIRRFRPPKLPRPGSSWQECVSVRDPSTHRGGQMNLHRFFMIYFFVVGVFHVRLCSMGPGAIL